MVSKFRVLVAVFNYESGTYVNPRVMMMYYTCNKLYPLYYNIELRGRFDKIIFMNKIPEQ